MRGDRGTFWAEDGFNENKKLGEWVFGRHLRVDVDTFAMGERMARDRRRSWEVHSSELKGLKSNMKGSFFVSLDGEMGAM